MSIEKKTIQIHPDLFNLSSSRTRKKRNSDTESSPASTNPIKIKKNKQESNKTVRNRILKYIREQQELKKEKDFDLPELSINNTSMPSSASGSSASSTSSLSPSSVGGGYPQEKSDFDDSISFMKSYIEKSAEQQKQYNQTIKNRDHHSTNVLAVPSVFNKALDQPNISLDHSTHHNHPPFTLNPPVSPNMNLPVYGCMKNGSLPTYRNWTNQTQKNNHLALHPSSNTHHPPQFSNNAQSYSHSSYPEKLENMTMTSIARANVNNINPSLSSPLNVLSERKYEFPNNGTPMLQNVTSSPALVPVHELKNNGLRPVQSVSPSHLTLIKEMDMRNKQMQNDKKTFLNRKQKKIIRRTYRVGKSKKYPRVSVLVSNKTMRRNVTSKTHDIKQVPIEEVKRTLVKHGFIKVGSSAPVDILRKMYESMILIGGQIENHNPDYLLHNYMKSSDSI
jgi:hypothetical protein